METNQRDKSQLMNFLEERGVTRKQFVEVLDVTERTFFFWIAGERQPRFTVKQIQDLCLLFDCSVHDIPVSFSALKSEAAVKPRQT